MLQSSLRVSPAFISRWQTTDLFTDRDGFPSDPKDIYLSAGASSGVNTLLHIICSSNKTGVLVPIPQYPLYTASLAVLDSVCVPYYLDESKNWGTDLEAIKTAYVKAQEEGIDVRAIVIINPGNPTGASLPKEDIEAVIKFAAQEKLVVLADEVYQTNVFIGKFHSFKAILRSLQKAEPGKYDNVELASLHSISKGMVGECGHRGGYFELTGFDPEVVEQIYKFVSITLCSPVIGQCLVEMMCNPPKEGEPSYELYKQEWDGIFAGLQKRATALYEAFKEMEGVECGEPQVCLQNSLLENPLMSCRVLCTSSLPSSFHKRPSKPLRKKAEHRMSSMPSVFLTQQECVSLLDLGLARRKVLCISERLSWPLVPSGSAELLSFTRTLWLNSSDI